jgi:hypothetical protein
VSDVTDEDEETETTATESACDESQSDTSNARAVARDVAARLSTIRVSKPPARRR